MIQKGLQASVNGGINISIKDTAKHIAVGGLHVQVKRVSNIQGLLWPDDLTSRLCIAYSQQIRYAMAPTRAYHDVNPSPGCT